MTFGYNSGTGYVKPLIRRQEGVLPLSSQILRVTLLIRKHRCNDGVSGFFCVLFTTESGTSRYDSGTNSGT